MKLRRTLPLFADPGLAGCRRPARRPTAERTQLCQTAIGLAGLE